MEVATEASIPSTIVKVVQLFFALPAGASEKTKENPEARLIQLLGYMCNFRYAVVELMKTDTLVLLFNMISSECPPHNVVYRDHVLGVLSSIIKYHIDRETVDYLKKRVCNIYS